MKLWASSFLEETAADHAVESSTADANDGDDADAITRSTATALFPAVSEGGQAPSFVSPGPSTGPAGPFDSFDYSVPIRFGAGSTTAAGTSTTTTTIAAGESTLASVIPGGPRGKKIKYNSQKRGRTQTKTAIDVPANLAAAIPADFGSPPAAIAAASAILGTSPPIFKFNTLAGVPTNVPTTAAAALTFGADFVAASTSNGGSSIADGHAVTNDHSAQMQHGEELTTSNSADLDLTGPMHQEPFHHADDAENHIPWRPQQTTSTCEFTHTITSYSQKRDSGCKKAEYSATTVDCMGNKWRLIVYVNGNGRASNHHLSLFLQVADAEELPFGWNKAVSYVLTLEHPNGGECVSINSGGVSTTSNNTTNGGNSTQQGYAKRNPDKTFKMCPKAIDWGWSQFIASDRILREGYVDPLTDTLVVRAAVTVKSSSVEIDPEDAELYLKCAVEEGNVEGVKACLLRDASVNCQFKDDLYTPLHTACSVNSGENSSSANSSSSSSNGNSSPGPIPPGSLEVLELLLEQGADVNACNKWRETPLLIAANNGHADAVRALLRHGADPGLCSEAGWSALTFAAHKGYDEIVSALLHAGAPVNCRVTEDLSTPLHKACAGSKPGHLSAVHMLLEGDADVHALNKWRETPLLTAANHGQCEAVEALLEYGADPCKCTDTGWSPLSIAAYKGHDDVVRLLLEEGAPTEEDDPTLSALLQAATKGLPDTVMLLLEHGADHTVTTKKGDTALSILVEQNLIDAAVEMVTDYNASIPRCSRDRKKVQRARLLINLRLKQMQRDGTGPYCDDDESDEGESSDAEEMEHGSAPLHHESDGRADLPATCDVGGGMTSSKKKKGKNKNIPGQKSIAKAEAEARAAEEALLLELEEEEKERTAASEAKSAKKKKQKKKEKERMLREAEKSKEEEAKLAALKTKEQQEKKSRLKLDDSFPSSPAKKEIVIEISSNTVAKSLPEYTKKSENKVGESLPSHQSYQHDESGKQPSQEIPNSKLQKKKETSQQSVKNAKEPARNKEAPQRQLKDSSLPKPTGSSLPKTESAKKPPPAKNSTGVPRKTGDNPISKKIPGDNPIPKSLSKRIPGDNPLVKKIPGDNPKVPMQQSRQSLQSTAAMAQAKPSSPVKSKRGWESKADKPSSSTESSVASQPRARQQKPHPTTSAPSTKEAKKTNISKEAVSVAGTKYPPGTSRKEISSPPNKTKPRSDESTNSTANSTAADSLPPTPTETNALPQKVAITPRKSRKPENNSVDDQLANMANDVLGFLDFDPQPAPPQQSSYQEYRGGFSCRPNSAITPPVSAPVAPQIPSVASAGAPHSSLFMPPMSIELPSISTFRLEKLNELFRRCSDARSSPNHPLRVIDEHTLRVVIYRWIIRASHGVESFLDPVIPSWEDEEFLKAFLQRQFISESRRSIDDTRYRMNVPSIEVLRDAGAAMSELCLSLAKEVSLFRSKCIQQVPSNWSDADINISGIQEGDFVIIEWSGKFRMSIPFSLFTTMARRYIGEQNRLMAAVFSAVRRHEIVAAIADQTNMISHLPSLIVDSLSKGLGANLETWSDSVSVHGNNSFCTMFPDVDAAFGGLPPFAKEKGGGESVLVRAGGSVIVVAPPENATASQCIRKVIDLVEASPNNPLSFSAILSSDCFVNASTTLSVDDLRTLDPRLCGEQNSFISYFEEIPAGVSSLSKSSSMFMLIQNEPGRRLFPPHPSVMDSIRCTMRSDLMIINNAPVSPSYSAISTGFDSSTFPSMPQHSYSVQENPFATNLFSVAAGGGGAGNRGRGHRGRLFDLVGEEDAEEDQGMNILPMLDSLNVDDMFGHNNTNEDIDIEAISLMGIGLNGALSRYGNQS